jgi:hypothetical protein
MAPGGEGGASGSDFGPCRQSQPEASPS